MTRRVRIGAAAISCLLVASGAARADAIDGEWCYSDGRSFRIAGPRIVTSTGLDLDGSYGRHDFNYTVPASGVSVFMILINDQTVHLREGRGGRPEPDARVEIWWRCRPQAGIGAGQRAEA